ncbi:MAG: hypothetical protein HW387_755 [Parachlamydiales bacterium]|nr:hypothetical protein [Parachlamydiales bacterium]
MLKTDRISFALVLLVVFLDHAGMGLVYPIFSSMIFQQGSSFVFPDTTEMTKGLYFGLLLGVPACMSFISGPILGALSDQTGRKPMYIYSLLLALLGYGLCIGSIWIQSLFGLIIARAVTGFAAGNAAVVCATIADLSNAQNKIKNFGLYSMAAGTGFAVGPFIGGWFSQNGYMMPFLMAEIAMGLNLICIYFWFRETRTVTRRKPIKMADGLRNLKKAFHIPSMRIFFIGAVFFCGGWSLFYEFMPVIWISDYGLDATQVGLLFTVGAAVYALSAGLLIRPIVDRYAPLPILFYSLVAMGCVILTLLLQPSMSWTWIAVILVNFLVALAYPVYNATISNSVDADSQGEILGIAESVQTASFGLSPLLAGLMISWNIHTPLALGGVFILAAALLFKTSKIQPPKS